MLKLVVKVKEATAATDIYVGGVCRWSFPEVSNTYINVFPSAHIYKVCFEINSRIQSIRINNQKRINYEDILQK